MIQVSIHTLFGSFTSYLSAQYCSFLDGMGSRMACTHRLHGFGCTIPLIGCEVAHLTSDLECWVASWLWATSLSATSVCLVQANTSWHDEHLHSDPCDSVDVAEQHILMRGISDAVAYMHAAASGSGCATS